LRVLSRGKTSLQRVALGDTDGPGQSLTENKGKLEVAFRSTPRRVSVRHLMLRLESGSQELSVEMPFPIAMLALQ
jgi:hypothetical protein